MRNGDHFGQTQRGMSKIHIIGAGLAGLSAAIAATGAGRQVTVYEATAMGGGRCRSYYDPELEINLDNGNHMMLSGNLSTLKYIDAIGARDRIRGPGKPVFPFLDVRTAVLNDTLEDAFRQRHPGFRPANDDRRLTAMAA